MRSRTATGIARDRSWARWLAIVCLAGLLILHLDFWREQRPELVFGWLPEDVAYRLAWMGLAFVYLWFFTKRVWREEGES